VESVIRLLPYAIADGATNMAADETLARSAAAGLASIRFYGWTEATLSLGYFQPAAVRHADSRLTNLPWVRRPSGGATLVHHYELTYCLALPAGAPWQAGEPWMPRMHRIITAALADLGLAGKVEPVRGESVKHSEVLCFQQFTPGDLLSGSHKVVGSAQRKYHQALMQHGSILLAQSEFTPNLPGIQELTGTLLTPTQLQDAVVRAFTEATGWRMCASEWDAGEMQQNDEMSRAKYATTAWNERR
jgi:lipoate-protein ligase A